MIPSGPRAGWPHMAGWFDTALDNRPVSICPRCAASIIPWSHGELEEYVIRHERWHAQTDHRIPPGVMAEIPEPIWSKVVAEWGILR